MATYEVAHIREQGVDLIIVPLKSTFGARTRAQQIRVLDYLQGCATRAGLAGTVVPVWDAGGGRMGFLAPRAWHPFFRSVGLSFVAANINRRLICQ